MVSDALCQLAQITPLFPKRTCMCNDAQTRTVDSQMEIVTLGTIIRRRGRLQQENSKCLA